MANLPEVPLSVCANCAAGYTVRCGIYRDCIGSSDERQASCAPCETGTYKSSIGSSSCVKCESGSFQEFPGSASCTSCGEHTTSVGEEKHASNYKSLGWDFTGSIYPGTCRCDAGFTGHSETGGICSACPGGTFKESSGAEGCSSCPSTSMSLPGSSSEEDCGAAFSVITFSATVQMSKAEFDVDATSLAYISGVAAALQVAKYLVTILSVVQLTAGQRRQLLVATALVETRVTVLFNLTEAVAGRITTENLNAALLSWGMSLSQISDVSTVSENVETEDALSGGGIAALVVCGMALVAIVWCGLRMRRSAQVAALSLPDLVRSAAESLGSEFRVNPDDKFAPTDLVFGKYDQAAQGLPYFLCVESQALNVKMGEQEFAIVREIQTFGTDSDKVCILFSTGQLA